MDKLSADYKRNFQLSSKSRRYVGFCRNALPALPPSKLKTVWLSGEHLDDTHVLHAVVCPSVRGPMHHDNIQNIYPVLPTLTRKNQTIVVCKVFACLVRRVWLSLSLPSLARMIRTCNNYFHQHLSFCVCFIVPCTAVLSICFSALRLYLIPALHRGAIASVRVLYRVLGGPLRGTVCARRSRQQLPHRAPPLRSCGSLVLRASRFPRR